MRVYNISRPDKGAGWVEPAMLVNQDGFMATMEFVDGTQIDRDIDHIRAWGHELDSMDSVEEFRNHYHIYLPRISAPARTRHLNFNGSS